MAIIISSTHGNDLALSAWSWGVLHKLVADAGLFPQEDWELFRVIGGDLDMDQVSMLKSFLEEKVLPQVQHEAGMLLDGSIAAVTDDKEFYREEGEQWKNYLLPRETLVRVVDFLGAARGPVSFF